jgi:hypothetical protein
MEMENTAKETYILHTIDEKKCKNLFFLVVKEKIQVFV